jgi:hypothetical protein
MIAPGFAVALPRLRVGERGSALPLAPPWRAAAEPLESRSTPVGRIAIFDDRRHF